MASEQPSTPPISRASSRSSHGKNSRISLDLSDLPALIQPSPPSNTLLITNLQDPTIFTSTTLAHLRELISQHSPDGLNSFSPLRALRRIIVSFPTIASAIAIRSMLDGEILFGSRVRVYFGEPTPTDPLPDQHLRAPKASKQFFISPPPSPPHGWESKDEGPPNKEVHADDLVAALERLSARRQAAPPSPTGVPGKEGWGRRSRSSTVVYDPGDHGDSPDLPAVIVEDTTESSEELMDFKGENKQPMIHTSRPPVELMSEDWRSD